MFNKRIKSILVLLIIAIVAVLFLSWGGRAQPENVAVKFQIKYLGFDEFNNGFKMHVNVSTNAPGHLTYVEEYYTLDGYSNPKYVSSSSFDGGDLLKINKSYNASFDILRPSGSYKLVKSIVLLDGSRVFEYWLTKNRDFIDNTGTADDGEDALLVGMRNIDRYETVEKTISTDAPAAFKYSTLGDISEVDVTGTGNDDVSLKVELLKGRDSLTDKSPGTAYRYLNIKADSVRIRNVSVMYRVDNAWMKKRSIPAKNVRMLGWDPVNKKWTVLRTAVLDNDSQYTYFKSVSDTLPYFAIAGQPVRKTVPKVNATNKTVTAKAKNDTVKATPAVGTLPAVKSVPGFGYLVALIALIVVYEKRRKFV